MYEARILELLILKSNNLKKTKIINKLNRPYLTNKLKYVESIVFSLVSRPLYLNHGISKYVPKPNPHTNSKLFI